MPTVEFHRTMTVGSPPETVWNRLTDVGTVASWVSVVGEVTELEPLGRYQVVLADRLGPFKLSAPLAVVVSRLEPPTAISFRAEGEDRQVSSRIEVEADIRLAFDDPHSTIEVKGRYQVTGRVATLGASMIKAKGEKILDEFFDNARAVLS